MKRYLCPELYLLLPCGQRVAYILLVTEDSVCNKQNTSLLHESIILVVRPLQKGKLKGFLL